MHISRKGVEIGLIESVKCGIIAGRMKEYMLEALEEARKARDCGEIPIGAVIEKDGRILGRGHNLTESRGDPTAHAEMLALREAAKALGGWRLTGCHLYVTVEPCAMCAGAIVWARIQKLYIGTMDPKGGGCGSVFNIPQEKKLNHYVETERGLLQEDCAGIMKEFFKELRQKKVEEKREK